MAPTTDSALVDEATPRQLGPRQAEIVQRLVEATVEEVAAAGPEGFTVRGAARRAGVAPATAYTYFSSKEHLLAETMWRRMRALPPVEVDAGSGTLERVSRVLGSLGTYIADEPAFTAAVRVALLSSNPDVERLRDRIGAEIHRRLVTACGEDTDPAVVRALELAYTGAMITAGMGHMSFSELPERMAEVARLLLAGDPSMTNGRRRASAGGQR